MPADIDETPRKDEPPRRYAERIAREKAVAVAASLGPRDGGTLVLAADTVVSAGRRILGKPADAGEAAQFLMLLSGRRHRVATAVCLLAVGPDGTVRRERLVETKVAVKRLSDAELSAYLRSGEWRGKAGGYAIQGIAAAFIPEIFGSYTNVVGLPLTETAGLLEGSGYGLGYEGEPA
jgi:septum formation protein